MAESVTRFLGEDASLGSTIKNLEGRLGGFGNEVENVGKTTNQLPAMFVKAAAAIAAFVGGFVVAQVSIRTFMDAIAKAGELDNLSKRTGETAGNLAILQRAFENAGMSAGDVGPVIGRLQKFIFDAGFEGSKQAKVLEWFGLTLQDLEGKTPTEAFELFAQRIQDIEDPMRRAAAAQLLLNKNGTEALPLFLEMAENIKVARAQLGSYPEAIDKSSKAMNQIGSDIDAIKNKGLEFATGLLVSVAPAIAKITSSIAQIDATRFGMILSEYLAKFLKAADAAFNFSQNIDAVTLAIRGMASGNIGQGFELLFLTAKIQALSLVNEFIKSFVAALQTIGGFFSTMFAGNGALMHLLSTTFGMIGDRLTANFSRALAVVFDNIPGIGKQTAEALRYSAETAERSFNMSLKGIGAQVDLVGDQLFRAGAALPTNFYNNRSKLQPMFDLTNDINRQRMLMGQIEQHAGNTGQKLDGAGKVFQGSIESTDRTLSKAPNYGKALEGSAEAMDNKSRSFRHNVEQSKVSAEITAKFYDQIGERLVQVSNTVSLTSEKVARVFQGVVSAGVEFDAYAGSGGKKFLDATTKASDVLVRGVQNAMKELTISTRGLATERTLSLAVRELQLLNRRLPQPVLV